MSALPRPGRTVPAIARFLMQVMPGGLLLARSLCSIIGVSTPCR